MRDYITQKLKVQYLTMQKRKLDADPYWKHLHRLINDVVAYSALPINDMQDSNGVPNMQLRSIQAQAKDYLDTMYPYLSDRPQGLISYVKYHGTEPWHHAFIIEPTAMSLPAIDKRLDLFKEYLRYSVDYLAQPLRTMQDFAMYGFLTLYNEQPLSFDEWLYYNNYDRLVHVIFNHH